MEEISVFFLFYFGTHVFIHAALAIVLVEDDTGAYSERAGAESRN